MKHKSNSWTWSGADQVVVCMFRLEHPRDVLQVVQVDLLRARPGEGHGDDALRHVGKVKFISLLHFCWIFLLKQTEEKIASNPATRRHYARDFIQVNI